NVGPIGSDAETRIFQYVPKNVCADANENRGKNVTQKNTECFLPEGKRVRTRLADRSHVIAHNELYTTKPQRKYLPWRNQEWASFVRLTHELQIGPLSYP